MTGSDDSASWHYGVVAQWWAEFNVAGPEIDYFRSVIETSGSPALDLACGTGRLMRPYLRDGIDIDGCDVSADMLHWCRELAGRDGLRPQLHHQAMHELRLPRRYQTVIICGGLGIGGDRVRDRAALTRVYEHLQPGGTLAFDVYVGYGNKSWRYWQPSARQELPEPSVVPGPDRTAADGSALGLAASVVDFDPLDQVVTYAMRARRYRDGHVEADEQYTLKEVLYLRNEILLMLELAGFDAVVVEGDYQSVPATAESSVLTFLARRPSP